MRRNRPDAAGRGPRRAQRERVRLRLDRSRARRPRPRGGAAARDRRARGRRRQPRSPGRGRRPCARRGARRGRGRRRGASRVDTAGEAAQGRGAPASPAARLQGVRGPPSIGLRANRAAASATRLPGPGRSRRRRSRRRKRLRPWRGWTRSWWAAPTSRSPSAARASRPRADAFATRWPRCRTPLRPRASPPASLGPDDPALLASWPAGARPSWSSEPTCGSTRAPSTPLAGLRRELALRAPERKESHVST